MTSFIKWFFSHFLHFSLRLRYKVEVRGLDTLSKERLSRPKGILFLANHPAEIDPCILIDTFWKKYRIHPIAMDYLFRIPMVRFFFDLIGALPVPNFEASSNSYKRRQMEKTYETIFDLLDRKENILLYPGGGLKGSAEEKIGGASGVYTILQARKDINVVLVRTTGLWGSSFSRALNGKTPEVGKVFSHGFKIILKNLLFFTPRRKVLVECETCPQDFPWDADKKTLNRYLENWFNKSGPEPLTLVSYSCFKKDYPAVKERKKADEMKVEENIPDHIREEVLAEIADLSKMNKEEIQDRHYLAEDLSLDSLDLAQIIVFLKENFGISQVNSTDLATVQDVFAFAAGIKKSKGEEEEERPDPYLWKQEEERPALHYPESKSLIEAFLKTSKRLKNFYAAADLISGEVTYHKLLLGVLLLAESLRKLPPKKIGILMPASVTANALILACMLAGKIPVMVNWTVGKRNLQSVVSQTGITMTISSWQFLNRLENVDLDGLDDRILLLEEMKRDFSFLDYSKAFFRRYKSPKGILKTFGASSIQEEDTAVILFTSGTESYPKGVPLSHRNLLSNQRGAFEKVHIQNTDVLLGCLPPFHSFGFSVTGLLPIIGGLRVAYSANPTDGRALARAIKRWEITLLCLAPTFFKNLLRVCHEEMKQIRLIVLGAEKAGEDLYEKGLEKNPDLQILEGYGITECSPIITLNPPDTKNKGVGSPLPGIKICIVDTENHHLLAANEKGLILVQGDNVFSGYLDPKLAEPFLQIEGEKWYNTGDLGYLDEEGYLTLSGRLKRFVKIGGEMVSLSAIEEILVQHAKEKNWKLAEDVPSLAICAKEEEGKKSEIHLFTIFDADEEQANQLLRASGMSNLVKIRSVHKLSHIPLLGTGKIDYKRLESQLGKQ